MSGGANAASATIISSLPYSDSDTVPGPAGLWYRYDAPTPADPNEIGLFAYAAVAPATLGTQVFSPDSVTRYPPSDPITEAFNRAIQLPVVAGVSYYFNLYNQVAGTKAYTFSVVAGPMAVAPVGSIFVNDDVDGWPLALLSSTDGTPLQYVHPFPASENADVLVDGRILVHDGADNHLKLYSPQFALLADLDDTPAGSIPRFPIRSNKTSRFYVGKPTDPGNANHASVRTVTSAGAFGPTTWNLPAAGLIGLAPSLDETVLYLAGQTSTLVSPVGQWDLVNDVALPNLVAGLANYHTRDDILVLDDASIIVSYEHTTVTTAPLVKRYDATGVTLNTYTMTGSRSEDVRLAYALDDPVSFWVWTKCANGISRFTNLKASDGSTLTTFDVPQFEDGQWAGAITATPSARFGASESCPFLITRQLVTGTIAASTILTASALTGYALPPRHRPCPTV